MNLADILGGPFIPNVQPPAWFQEKQERELRALEEAASRQAVSDDDFLESIRLRPEDYAKPAHKRIHFSSEPELQAAVESFFRRLQTPHSPQKRAGYGVVDICLERGEERKPWGLIELKNADFSNLSLKDAADFFEQAVKYRIQSRLPVFLGPVFITDRWASISSFFAGGRRFGSTAAISALGGRVDVGLLFIHSRPQVTDQTNWRGFQLTMRQRPVAGYHVDGLFEDAWPEQPIAAVNHRSAGSRKDRE